MRTSAGEVPGRLDRAQGDGYLNPAEASADAC
jgi:hypothetical protein